MALSAYSKDDGKGAVILLSGGHLWSEMLQDFRSEILQTVCASDQLLEDPSYPQGSLGELEPNT